MSGIATSVIPLLSEWEKYIRDHPGGDIPGFAHWILANQPNQNPPPPSNADKQLPPTSQASLFITRLFRIFSLLSKSRIKSFGLTNDLEFATLIHVAIMDQPNKKELCRELLIENSTGVEITRRLSKKGLLAEKPDPNDRRSARLSVTEKGKKMLMHGAELFRDLHTTFYDILSTEEQLQLANLLGRLNQYHTKRINENPDLMK